MDSSEFIFSNETTVTLHIRTENGSELAFNFFCGHGVSPKNSIKGREKIRLFRRLFTPLLKKSYSFSIKMSTRIKRLSFEMLYCKAKSKNADFRKEHTMKGNVIPRNYNRSRRIDPQIPPDFE
jgi:hypothetical protein